MMIKKARINQKNRIPALTVRRSTLLSKDIVYVVVSNKPLKYHNGKSCIVYVGKLKHGAKRIAHSAVNKAEDILAVNHGVRKLDVIALSANHYDLPFVKDLVHDVLDAVKKNLRIDWTKPHRDSVKASVAASVKRVLRRRGVKQEHFQFILTRVMEQAEARFADWPMVA